MKIPENKHPRNNNEIKISFLKFGSSKNEYK